MAKGTKTIGGGKKSGGYKKEISGGKKSTDGEKVIWCFEWLDKSGPFSFDLSRPDFDHREILEKIIAYSNMTWSEVKRQTHDDGKSKHHMLDFSKLGIDAGERIRAKKLEQYTDSIFSFALQNKLRIIGIRKGQLFYAVWFDPGHQFCPSKKK